MMLPLPISLPLASSVLIICSGAYLRATNALAIERLAPENRVMQQQGLNPRASIDPQHSHERVDVVLCIVSAKASKDTSLCKM